MVDRVSAARLVATLVTLLLTVGALWFAAAPAAQAHALLVSSSPAAESALSQMPRQVVVTFSENVEPRLSSLQVLDSSGRVVSGPVHPASGSALTASLPPLLGGVYTVRWRSVSSDDGHVTSGSFTFGVGPLAYAAMSGPAPELLSVPNTASAPVVAGIWIFDAGLGLLAGGCWIAAFGFPRGTRRPLILALSGAVTLVAGLITIGWSQAAADHIDVAELASTSLGLGLLVQLIPALAAAACTGAALLLPVNDRKRRPLLTAPLIPASEGTRRRLLAALLIPASDSKRRPPASTGAALLLPVSDGKRRPPIAAPLIPASEGKRRPFLAALLIPASDGKRRPLVIAALILAATTAAGHVLTTHAASGPHATAELMLQWLHVASFATWIGGLAALLLALGTEPSEDKAAAVRRFSRVAGCSLAVLCLSGVLRALAEVAAWHSLLNTLFGQLVLLKVGLLAVLTALGAYNRFRVVPITALRKLRRVGSIELGVASLALIAAATLSSSLPPALAAATPAPAPPPRVLVSGTANGVRAELEVSPDYVGPNRFTLRLYDATSKRALSADTHRSARLVFSPVARPTSASPATTISLAPSPDGSYAAVGDDQLSSIGRWNITADVEVTGQESALAIPLSLTCVPSPDQLEEMTMGRMSMAYGIQLSGGLQLDAYLTPGHAGPDALHVAFTDQRNAPIPLGGPPVVTFRSDAPNGPARQLPMRPLGSSLLDQGQYFGAAVFAAGRWDFHVAALDTNGKALTADFVLSVT